MSIGHNSHHQLGGSSEDYVPTGLEILTHRFKPGPQSIEIASTRLTGITTPRLHDIRRVLPYVQFSNVVHEKSHVFGKPGH
jgi:hypothetical protein